MPRESTSRHGVWWIAVPFLVTMAAIAPFDYAWTVCLTQVRIPAFVEVMRRTLFEGGGPGGSDLPIVVFLAVFAAYLWSGAAEAPPRLLAWRPMLGYLTVSALAAGLGVVHAIKWVLGRARPWSVLGREHLPYSDWYQFGPHYVTEGIYRGSFPSGHTAAVFILMALVYAYDGGSGSSLRRRILTWLLGAAVLAYSAAMGVASSMARSHWLSDVIGSVGMVWIVIHVLYHLVLRVPEQTAHWRSHGRHLALPRFWELRLCGWGGLVLLGLMAIGLGVRAFWEQEPPYLAVLIPLGGGLAWLGYPRARATVRALHRQLDAQQSTFRA